MGALQQDAFFLQTQLFARIIAMYAELQELPQATIARQREPCQEIHVITERKAALQQHAQ